MESEDIKNTAKAEEENAEVNDTKNTEVENETFVEKEEVSEGHFVLTDKNETKRKGIINDILSCVMDQLITLCLSALILVIFGFLIKFAGYYVAMPVPVLFIIYAIVGCIYAPILKHSKLNRTIGEKIINI